MGWPEVTEKFRVVTRGLLGLEEQDRICETVFALEESSGLGGLCEIMARPAA